MKYKQELAAVNASLGQAGKQAEQDRLDAVRYRKYRAMVIAGLAEPVTTAQFDADIDAAVVSGEILLAPQVVHPLRH